MHDVNKGRGAGELNYLVVIMGSYNYYKMFGCFNRKFKISESEPPPDVREAFWRYTDGSDRMTADQLHNFMVEHQREDGCTADNVEAIMQRVFHHRHHTDRRRHFSLDDFFYYLFRDDLNGPINTEIYHDMTAPLPHYFIFTGHNSYLTGNQLSSDCSEIPIIRSLENGVRGIELDLWPNSTKDNVHVLHGRTLTTPVPLMKCLKSIREHAFVKSPYPVIITLEDHLTPELQAKVAEMVTDIFGDMLYCPQGNLDEFPSPQELQHKIILSTKPPKEYLGTDNNKEGEPSSPREKDSSDDELEVEADGIKIDSDDEEDSENLNKKPGTAPRYKRLIAINAGTNKKTCSGSLEEFTSPEDLQNQIIPSPKSPKEYLETNDNMDGKSSSPKEKDSSDDEPGADDTKSDSDDEDIENSKKKLGTAPRYKRLIAINAGSAKKKCSESLEEFSTPKDLQEKNIPSPKSPKEYLKTNSNKDGESSSPKEKDSSDDETGADDIKSDSDDGDSENLNKKPGTAPRYKRLIAINAGTAQKNSSMSLEEFPSPKDLQNKIILSPKTPKEYLETNNNKDGEYSSPKEKDSSDDESGAEADDIKSDSDDEYSDNFNKRSGGAPQYKRLIAIHAGNAKKKCLRQVLNFLGSSAVRLSLSEQELEKAAALHATDVVSFTQKNILRVFPKGTRVTSSNFRPVNGWIHGAQMVAFNMQGYGKSLWMMHGLFRSNGGCGYIKKPDVLIMKGRNSEAFDPRLPWPVRKTLKVIVYMGDGWRLDFSHTHFDTFSPPDFYTKIYIQGVPIDDARTKTKVKEDDWAPYWDQEFSFPLRIPELALLRIEVREYDRSDKDDFGGQTCLPVSELRSGIRAVPLYDKRGKKFKSVRLLMQFQFE